MEDRVVCYTKDAALKMAVELEHSSFETYLKAYKLSHDLRAKMILKELALEELEHKYILEKAFFEEAVSLHDEGAEAVQSLRLTSFLTAKPLDEHSTPQDVMIHAIHEEKRSVDFYNKNGHPVRRCSYSSPV